MQASSYSARDVSPVSWGLVGRSPGPSHARQRAPWVPSTPRASGRSVGSPPAQGRSASSSESVGHRLSAQEVKIQVDRSRGQEGASWPALQVAGMAPRGSPKCSSGGCSQAPDICVHTQRSPSTGGWQRR